MTLKSQTFPGPLGPYFSRPKKDASHSRGHRPRGDRALLRGAHAHVHGPRRRRHGHLPARLPRGAPKEANE